MTTTGGGRNWVELVATVLLALATVATAWSGYQSTRWNGEQAKAGARANALRIDSAKAAGLANSQTEIDVATFTQWVNAYAQEQTELADFYFKRFREEFRPAVDAWVATRPLQNPDAPLTPFAMPQYKLAARAEADRARRRGGAVRRGGAAEHPARVELRARCRPVRLRVVLRRHEHQADVTEAARCDARDRLRRLPRHGDLDRDLAGQPLRLTTGAPPATSRSCASGCGRIDAIGSHARASPAPTVPAAMLECDFCGCYSPKPGKGWFAVRRYDPEGIDGVSVAVFCPPCAAAEFGHRPRPRR